MIKLKPVIYINISFFFIFVTNFIYATEFSWKFNNGLPETRKVLKEVYLFPVSGKEVNGFVKGGV